MDGQTGTPVQTVCQLQYRSLGPNSGGQSGGSRPFPSLHPRPRFLGGPPPRRVGPQAPRTAPTRPRCPPCRAAPSRPPSAPPSPRRCPGLAPWLVVFGGGVLLLFSSFGLGGGGWLIEPVKVSVCWDGACRRVRRLRRGPPKPHGPPSPRRGSRGVGRACPAPGHEESLPATPNAPTAFHACGCVRTGVA